MSVVDDVPGVCDPWDGDGEVRGTHVRSLAVVCPSLLTTESHTRVRAHARMDVQHAHARTRMHAHAHRHTVTHSV